MRLKLSNRTKHLKGLTQQIRDKAGNSKHSARIIKGALFVKGAKATEIVEKSYQTALEDMAHILETKSRLPQSPTLPGNKTVRVKPYMHKVTPAITPFYNRLKPATMRRKRADNGRKVFWYESGWFASRMRKKLQVASHADWKLRRIRYTGKLNKNTRVVMRAQIKAPVFYSTKINKLLTDPFMNASIQPHLPSYTPAKVGRSVADRALWLESRRPLLTVVMRQHGDSAWKLLKSEIF